MLSRIASEARPKGAVNVSEAAKFSAAIETALIAEAQRQHGNAVNFSRTVPSLSKDIISKPQAAPIPRRCNRLGIRRLRGLLL